MQKAVFLDRDGTINFDSGYINNPADFNLYPFAAQAIKLLNDNNFLVIVVTNQSGVSRGYYTINDLNKIHKKMNEELAKQKAFVNKLYFSPYHQDGKIAPFNIKHNFRKPDIGMFTQACLDFNIDVKNSYMVGDRLSDINFAKNCGLTPILVLTGDGEKTNPKPGLVAKNLLEAVKIIISKSK